MVASNDICVEVVSDAFVEDFPNDTTPNENDLDFVVIV
jgi:hypothetical protein